MTILRWSWLFPTHFARAPQQLSTLCVTDWLRVSSSQSETILNTASGEDSYTKIRGSISSVTTNTLTRMGWEDQEKARCDANSWQMMNGLGYNQSNIVSSLRMMLTDWCISVFTPLFLTMNAFRKRMRRTCCFQNDVLVPAVRSSQWPRAGRVQYITAVPDPRSD